MFLEFTFSEISDGKPLLAYLSSPFDLNPPALPATDVSSVVTSTENRNRRFALENAKNKVSQYFCFCVLLSLLQLALCVREIPQINGESFGVRSAKLADCLSTNCICNSGCIFAPRLFSFTF